MSKYKYTGPFHLILEFFGLRPDHGRRVGLGQGDAPGG